MNKKKLMLIWTRFWLIIFYPVMVIEVLWKEFFRAYKNLSIKNEYKRQVKYWKEFWQEDSE